MFLETVYESLKQEPQRLAEEKEIDDQPELPRFAHEQVNGYQTTSYYDYHDVSKIYCEGTHKGIST